MANSITKWWEKQKMRYNYQVALGQRDKFIAESLKEIDRGNSEINSAKLSDLDKEERRLEFMRDITNGPTGMSIRFSKCQERITDVMSKCTDDRELDAKGKGIGAFFGRLVSGRFSAASRDLAGRNVETFTTTAGFTALDENRLNKIKQDKAEARDLLQGAKDAVRNPENLSRVRAETAKALNQEDPTLNGDATQYSFGRQAFAFLEPGNMEHNKKVMRALAKSPIDKAVMVPLLKDAVAEVRNFDLNGLTPDNEPALRKAYPQLEEFSYKVHLISDLANKELTDQERQTVFGNEEGKRDFGARLAYIGGLRSIERARLFEMTGNDEKYMYETEFAKNSPDRPLSQALMQTGTGLNGIRGNKSFEEFKQEKIARDLAKEAPKKEMSVESLSEKKATVTKMESASKAEKVDEMKL